MLLQNFHHYSRFNNYLKGDFQIYFLTVGFIFPHYIFMVLNWEQMFPPGENWQWLELNTTEWLHFHFSLSCTGERNGNPLQCSCLENPRDGGAWWAAIYGVAQSRTRLTWLSSSTSSSSRLSVRASLIAQLVKNPPAMWETWIWSLHWEGPMEEGTATHSSILSWRYPVDRGAWWASVHGVTKSQIQLRDEAQNSAVCIC